MSGIEDLYSSARAAGHGVAVHDAVAFFVQALKDPCNPLSCCPSVVAAFLVIQPNPNNIEHLLKSYHTLWSTAISFLSADRSLQDMEALEDRWGHCRCKTSAFGVDGRLHTLAESLISWNAPGSPDSAFSVFINTLVALFATTFNSVNAVRIAKGRNSKMWPVSPGDLIPYSEPPPHVYTPKPNQLTHHIAPELSVKSIVNLSKFMGHSNVLLLLPFLVRTCRSLIIPAVISSHMLAKHVMEKGLKVCANVHNAQRAPGEAVNNVVAEQFCSFMTSVISLLSCIAECLPGQIRQFHDNGMAADYFEFLSQAVTIVESPLLPPAYRSRLEPSREGIAAHAGIIYQLFPGEMIIPWSRINPTIRRATDILWNDISDPAITVWELIRHARKTHICYALECTESLQTSGRMYQRCSGCMVVGYSSKECQMRGWKDPRAPHRDICKKLRLVFDAGKSHLEGDGDEGEFVRDMKRENIPDSLLCEIDRWLNNVKSRLCTADGSPAPGLKVFDEKGRATYVST
jgi:hypothetical protein